MAGNNQAVYIYSLQTRKTNSEGKDMENSQKQRLDKWQPPPDSLNKNGVQHDNQELCRELKIGATKTYKICKEHVDGFKNIGASLNDFKNLHRDFKCFIHERDGQLFVDNFKEMIETRIGFYFDYDIDDDGSLRRAIWADSNARENYKIFGDAVPFDPTYSTNKYSMVFTLFTGMDHDKRSMTFCGALIAREDYESFNWVFSQFLQVIGGVGGPEYIIIDLDPVIFKFVPLVFKTTRHRFCMWYIMNKVPSKFGVSRSDYSDFMGKLNDILSDEEVEVAEFNAIWEQIIEEHGLGANDWFADTYVIRGQWVMAHCRDLKMVSVMRTTQRSESENSFFKRFEHKSGTLVEFWMRFESAMDQQRHTQKELDNNDKHSFQKTSTHLMLESHGAKVYFYSAFYTFKEEAIYSIDTCRTGGFTERDELEVTTVKYSSKGKNFEVAYRIDNMEIIDGKQIAMSIMWSEVHQMVGLRRGKGVTDVESVSAIIRGFKDKLSPLGEVLNKNQQMEKILHCTANEVVTIFPPKNSKNKGSGKRMLSTKTKALALARKPKCKCKNCKRITNHDKKELP
ncbi:protein FAR-RED IMPAIRED RESPONSE 1-like [Silene latifolia]|uniref:protein FAR-RED IMPAIRED RESPONSE 1-like n=1 Tax=Silene latifolia TaxID=37657 RepID=UPI003D76AC80